MFPFHLAAYIYGDDGVFVMTNSDARSLLANEVAVTLAAAYGWSGPVPRKGGQWGCRLRCGGGSWGLMWSPRQKSSASASWRGGSADVAGGQCGAVGAPRRRALQKYYRGRVPKPPPGLMPA